MTAVWDNRGRKEEENNSNQIKIVDKEIIKILWPTVWDIVLNCSVRNKETSDNIQNEIVIQKKKKRNWLKGDQWSGGEL